MLKSFTVNTLWSTLALLLMSVIFTCIGFLLIELNLAPRFLVQVLFTAILILGYFIGGRLYYRNSLSIVSVVLFAHYLATALSLLLGARKKQKA